MLRRVASVSCLAFGLARVRLLARGARKGLIEYNNYVQWTTLCANGGCVQSRNGAG